ncbi:MAG: hypothetical protein E7479_01395 [Ruminococcaceae bacterium]|nr:hypothetical protein [Oscillospiraceae bacterium]
MENIENEMNYQKLIYEESLKQTELIEKQAKNSKIQTIIVSGLMLVVAVALLVLSVQVGGVLEQANSAIDEITVLTTELNTILEESQITELLNNANALIEESGDALTKALEDVDEALGTVSQIDIETLNSAIADLQKVIQPLAKLFGR